MASIAAFIFQHKARRESGSDSRRKKWVFRGGWAVQGRAQDYQRRIRVILLRQQNIDSVCSIIPLRRRLSSLTWWLAEDRCAWMRDRFPDGTVVRLWRIFRRRYAPVIPVNRSSPESSAWDIRRGGYCIFQCRPYDWRRSQDSLRTSGNVLKLLLAVLTMCHDVLVSLYKALSGRHRLWSVPP